MKLPFDELKEQMENASSEWATSKDALFFSTLGDINDRSRWSPDNTAPPHIWAANLLLRFALVWMPLLAVIILIGATVDKFQGGLDWHEFFAATALSFGGGSVSLFAWLFVDDMVNRKMKALPPHPLLMNKTNDPKT